jgi:hypothetical protein
MAIYLMSSPNLRGFGKYSYKSISMEEASRLLKGGFISAIRYQWDADMLRDFLGIHVPINREELKLEVGDSAIVIELPELDQSGNVSKVPKCIAMLTRTA